MEEKIHWVDSTPRVRRFFITLIAMWMFGTVLFALSGGNDQVAAWGAVSSFVFILPWGIWWTFKKVG